MDYFNKGRLSLSDEVYNYIVKKIVDNEWKIGEKLPSESQMCKIFGVSRTSVRAALQTLQGSGMIVTMQGVGSFVHKLPNEIYKQDVDIASDISSEQFKDFFEFRRAIEFSAIDFFVKRATVQEELYLAQIVKQMYEIQSKSDFAKKDFEFHMTIIKGAKNIFLTEAMHNNQEMFLHYMTEIIRLTKKPLSTLAEEHNKLYSFLLEKKANAAKEFLYHDNTYYHAAYFSPKPKSE